MLCYAYHVGYSHVTTVEDGGREHTGEGGPEGKNEEGGELHSESSMLLSVMTV